MQMERVLDLKPTQFALGYEQIHHKIDEMRLLKKNKLAEYLHEYVVPIIISPEGDKYLIDHHHFLFACSELGIQEVEVEVKGDLSTSHLSQKKFWRVMVRSHWAYLYDQFGEGPRSPLYLPTNIRGLADDPYRSLAWAVRTRGGYKQTDQTFAEFKWADFFRQAELLEKEGRRGMKRAIQKGLKLARSRKASRLPGYRGAAPQLPPVIRSTFRENSHTNHV